MPANLYRNILIATDGSELANHAVDQGLGLAKGIGAKVTAVMVTEMFHPRPTTMMATAGDVQRYEDAAAGAATKVLDRVRDAAAKLGVPCEVVHVVDEEPSKGILDTCVKQGCDLIVMATHARRGLDRLLVGSQTNKVMTLGHVPVLICR